MEGLAILRSWGTDPMAVQSCIEEIAGIQGALHEDLYGAMTAVPEYDVADGYGAWASTYDGMPNVLIEVEESVVRPLLVSAQTGRALDAACGTGRYATWLADQGHEVVGVDASEAMLRVARSKVPTGRFQAGQLFYSMLALVQEFLPHMVEQGAGAILTAQGGSTVRGLPKISGPGPAQAAQRNYLQSLQAEMADKGVYVGMLYIGAIIESSAFHAQIEEAKTAAASRNWAPTVDPAYLADLLWSMHSTKSLGETIYPEHPQG
jgi:hypothetical protein